MSWVVEIRKYLKTVHPPTLKELSFGGQANGPNLHEK